MDAGIDVCSPPPARLWLPGPCCCIMWRAACRWLCAASRVVVAGLLGAAGWGSRKADVLVASARSPTRAMAAAVEIEAGAGMLMVLWRALLLNGHVS